MQGGRVDVRGDHRVEAEPAAQCAAAVSDAAHHHRSAAIHWAAAWMHRVQTHRVEVEKVLKVGERVEERAGALVAAPAEGEQKVVRVRVPRNLLGRAADDVKIIERLGGRLEVRDAVAADDDRGGPVRKRSGRSYDLRGRVARMMVPAAAHARRVRAVEGEARAEDSDRRAALMVAAQRPDWAERWQACINRPARLRRVLLLPSRHRHKQHGLHADAEAAEVLRHCELDSRRASTVTSACETNMRH